MVALAFSVANVRVSRDCRVDLSDQVEEILANAQAKSAFPIHCPSPRAPTTVTSRRS